jgi:geranylgeranyl reductase family protein
LYDVAVVGAGPGGSTAARYMAKLGLNVCLVDKDRFPRDKPCGGGFSESILSEFPYLGRRRSDFLKGIATIGVLHSPNRRVVLRGRVNMAVALRLDFDNVLYESAVDAGAEAIPGIRVKDLEMHENVATLRLSDGNSIDAQYVIGADGVTSMVARKTGLNKRWQNTALTACRVAEVPARQRDIINLYTSDLEYHFYANLGGLPGYGWIFPKEQTINVGLGFVGPYATGLPAKFHTFVRYLERRNMLPRDADTSGARGALIPTGGPLERTTKGRCLILGDAAGMVSPLTGGGIGYAMRAGMHAAGCIARATSESSLNLEPFEKMWQQDFGKDFRNQLRAQRIFTSGATDLLFEIGKRDPTIQAMVSEAMSESSKGGIDLKRLVIRTLLVCLRGGLGYSPDSPAKHRK